MQLKWIGIEPLLKSIRTKQHISCSDSVKLNGLLPVIKLSCEEEEKKGFFNYLPILDARNILLN